MAGRELAAAISAAAAEWVVRVDRGLRPDERLCFEAWIEADPRHHGAFARAQALWLQADRTRIFAGAAGHTVSRRRGWRIGWAIAAGFAAVLLMLTLLSWQRYSTTHFATAVGEIRHIPLPDGSSMTLNTQSQIILQYSASARLIRLDHGEVLFDVVHDVSRPFVVEAGTLRVRAVGTAFVVRREDQADAEVTVTRGVVDVWRQTAVPEPSVRVAAGLRAVATPKLFGPVQTLSEAQVAQATAWQEGILDLEGRTLADAALEFNRYNRKKVVIRDSVLARERVVGRFSVSDPMGFATAAAAMLGARVRTEDESITVEGVVTR